MLWHRKKRIDCPEIGAISYTWSSSNSSILSVEGNGTYALLDAGYPGTCSFTVTITNNCGTTSQNYFAVVSDCSGGGGEMLVVYPNPATSTLTVQMNDSLSSETQNNSLEQPYSLHLLDRSSRKVYTIRSREKSIQIPVDALPPDIYYLNIFYKGAVLQKQIVIKR